MPTCVALVGDFNNEILAHRAINECFRLANQGRQTHLEPNWLGTDTIKPGDNQALAHNAGVWCVPGSPYRSAEGALWAIHYARTHAIPFLGTCGGYQHALLEFARTALNLKSAEHAEDKPSAPLPLINRLQCPLVEKSQRILVSDKEFSELYGGDSGIEGYHCSYGLDRDHEKLFAGTPIQIVARDENGEPRAFRLEHHPFFIGTAFQPERRALTGSLHPLVAAFFSVVAKSRPNSDGTGG
jgi:CTP synthase (UTP-ammonia lyase)